MPIVRVRVKLGAISLSNLLKPWPELTTLDVIIQHALQQPGHEDLHLTHVVVYPSKEEKPADANPLDIVDLKQFVLNDMRDFGYFIAVSCVRHDGNSGSGNGQSCNEAQGPRVLPNGLAVLMAASAHPNLVLPPLQPDNRFDYKIFNALVADLKSEALGWEAVDAAGSGKGLLLRLAGALQYILPFDGADVLKRRGIHIPVRFQAASLKVCTRSRHGS